MKRVLRQWLAGLLSVVMALTLLPAAALAEEADGSTENAVEQVQALIDELPETEEITDETRDDVQAQIDAIDAAMLELTGDQAAALDTTRYDAAVAAISALDGQAGDPAPVPSAAEQVQALIDALPDADTITAENRADVEAQLTAIDEAKLALEDEELDALDITRYLAAVEAILALDDMAGADEPRTIATSYNVANNSVTISQDGDYTITGTSTTNTITVTGGNVTITVSNVSVTSASGCAFDIQDGNVTVILNGTNSFTSGGGNAGIQVGIDAHLTIKGPGAVTAIAKKVDDNIAGAGIGGSSTQHAGYITIDSGTIVAKSEGAGAGIGGGRSARRGDGGAGTSGMFKDITINGGDVRAESAGEGAGIGCGGPDWIISMETITITGGLIHAKSGGGSAWDIGYGGYHSSDYGNISITGGMIYTEGDKGNGIGAQTVKKNNCLIIPKSGEIEFIGSPTVLADLTFPGSRSLTIQGGQKLTIPEGVTLTNYWDILNCGEIIVKGKLINYGKITNVTGGGKVTGSVQGTQPGSVAGTPYLEWDENAKKLIPCATPTVTVMTNQSGWLGNGWYIVNSDITYDGRMFIAGDDVHLILADGCTLTVTQGINVNYNKKVTIYCQTNGTGKLETTTNDISNSSFGTGNETNCGSITINGGTVIATSKNGGAGIGGGSNGQINDGDAITINGGTVIATSGYGAGIGSGNNSNYGQRNAGTININGGTVIATSNSGGAGIGGGSRTSGGWVTINGGTVTATSKGGGSGIGPGKDPVFHYSQTNGSFSTGTNGSAVIFANSISDQNGKGSWGGIIFEGNSGQVYGNQTLRQDLALSSGQNLTVPNGTSLTVPSGMTLTVPSGATVKNEGTINVGTKSAPGGSINIGGTINNTGTIDVWGGIEGENNIKNSGSGKVVYHFKLDITAPTFGQVTYGYQRPEKKAITIKNTGEVAAAITSVEITGTSLELISGNTVSLTQNQTNTSWTLQPKAGLNAGKYTETIKVKYTGNGGAVRTATAAVTFNVGKADPNVTPPTANSLTYNGGAQELVKEGIATGGTMQYSLNQNSDYSPAFPRALRPGAIRSGTRWWATETIMTPHPRPLMSPSARRIPTLRLTT